MPGRQVPATPRSYAELERNLHERLPSFSRAQQRVASRVLADPEGVAFMTISDLAEAAAVNESTVVRFATSVGLEGYPSLARLCQERLRAEAQLLRRFEHLRETSTGRGSILAAASEYDETNIRRSFARIDPDAWQEAVAAICAAPRVHVLGLRICYTVAYLLACLLELARDDVHMLTPDAGRLPEGLRRVRAGDMFIAVSAYRYTKDTVRGLRYARSVGATSLALTDNPASPLAQADHVLYVDTTGISIHRSLTALTSVAQALAAEVAAQSDGRTHSMLEGEERLLGLFETYEDTSPRHTARPNGPQPDDPGQ